MNRYKKLGILAIVLVVAIVATFAVSNYEERKEKISESGDTVLAVSADSVTALSWSVDDADFAFHKDESWLYDDDEAFPVSEDKINELLSLFEDFRAAFTIDEVDDLGQYGLDDPTATISFTADDTDYEVTLGDYSAMDSERYVSIGDGKVYLAVTDPLDSFDVELSDMIDNDEAPAVESLSAVQFSGSESYSIEYSEEGDSLRADDTYYAEIDGESLPLDPSRVERLMQTVSALDLTDYVSYNATDEELEEYGLASPELTITMDYGYTDEDGNDATDTFVISISRDPDELAAAEEAEAEGESEDEGEDTTESPAPTDSADGVETEEETVTAYARVGESQIIYKVSSDDYEDLMAVSYNDLRHREVIPAELDDAVQIDFTLEGESYTITAEGEDDERAWYYDGEELDSTELITSLGALRADSADMFTDEKPAQKEEISFTVTLKADEDAEDAAETPEATADAEDDAAAETAGTKISIVLYRIDGSYCLATVDGETFAKVSRADVVDIIEALNAIVLN